MRSARCQSANKTVSGFYIRMEVIFFKSRNFNPGSGLIAGKLAQADEIFLLLTIMQAYRVLILREEIRVKNSLVNRESSVQDLHHWHTIGCVHLKNIARQILILDQRTNMLIDISGINDN